MVTKYHSVNDGGSCNVLDNICGCGWFGADYVTTLRLCGEIVF
jgi:hypothetical protein